MIVRIINIQTHKCPIASEPPIDGLCRTGGFSYPSTWSAEQIRQHRCKECKALKNKSVT